MVTGGGDGMGRALVRQLAAKGCHVSLCDVNDDNMAETVRLANADSPSGTVLSSFHCDVSDEAQVLAFRDHVTETHQEDHVHFVFNNAGIGGPGSMIESPREAWEHTFNVCWYGVYYGTRAFLPLLVAGEGGHIVNTSSVNGFWASLGPARPHTSYSAAKFAVKGFTEALVQDLRMHAPHVHAHVVMPGHIGTGIVGNSAAAFGAPPGEVAEQAAAFRNNAPMTAETAAGVILAGVEAGEWRILVGEDAHTLDMMVRESPEEAYEDSFLARMTEQGTLANLARADG